MYIIFSRSFEMRFPNKVTHTKPLILSQDTIVEEGCHNIWYDI